MASKELFSLGKIYPSDFLKPDEQPRCGPVELKLLMDEYGLVRLSESAPKECMWGKYWYRSGINTTMVKELKSIVDSILPLMKFTGHDIWCDIAANDGTLLSFVPKTFVRIGIDPADDSFKEQSEKHADLIIQDYFSKDVFKNSEFGRQKIKVLTSIAMFYDVDDPSKFIKDAYDLLDDNGLWVMQVSYSLLMLKQVAFDAICHEHKYYYSLRNLMNLLYGEGFEVRDAQLNDSNGGSLRLYIMKSCADERKYGSQPQRDIGKIRTASLMELECMLNIGAEKTWMQFYEDIKQLKTQLMRFIYAAKENGKKIWAYGASTKGNTLLQYFELDNTLIDGIAERNMEKWGLRTVGTNIPIYSEEKMRQGKPDYLLILPWHFLPEFIERESEYLQGGGKFIVPCPKFEIIGV
jgi:hypothetical protein